MTKVEHTVEVRVPARTAYDQWTQFEEFPRFMESVQEIDQLTDRRLRWRAEVGGIEQEWEAEITEQIPGKRIAWISTSGFDNAGCVTFHRLADDRTRVMLQVEYRPRGMMQKLGDKLGIVDRMLATDLRGFKEFLESRDAATGAWRGAVPAPEETRGATRSRR